MMIHPEYTRDYEERMREAHGDPDPQPEKKPRLILPVGIWLFVILAVIGGAVGLSAGCATVPAEPTAQVCYLKMMGTTEEGYTVVMQACMSPEQYAEGQR